MAIAAKEPKQYRTVFAGQAAQSHKSRPGPLETSLDSASVNLDLCLKLLKRLMSFNHHFSEPC